jgi:hypothetical protein
MLKETNMAQVPENIKNMWFDAAKEPVTISEPTNYTKSSAIDSLIEKLETENEALFLVIEGLLDRLVTEETLVGIKVSSRPTRKHMVAVANAIKNLPPEERQGHHKTAAAYFAKHNERFNHSKFRQACGVSDGMDSSDYVKEQTILEKFKKVSSEIRHLMKDKGYPKERAVAAALQMKSKGELED